MENQSHWRQMASILLISTLLIVLVPATHANDSTDEFVVDGRTKLIAILPDQAYHQSMEVDAGTVVSVNVGCSSCEVRLETGDTTLISSTSVTFTATEASSIDVHISSSLTETVSTSFLVSQDEAHLAVRPSPQTSIDLVDSYRCTSPELCMDMHRGNLMTILTGEYSVLGFDTGAVELNAEEYYGFRVLTGEIVELTLHHASDSLRFDFYFQTDTTESLLEPTIESMTASNPSTIGETSYISIEEDGRIIVKVSTSATHSAYALQRVIHDPQLTMTIENDTSQFTQIGHESSTTAFAVDATSIVQLAPVIEDVTARLAVRIGDSWVNMPEITVEQNTVERIYVYPNSTMAMLTIESDVHWVDVTLESFADGNASIDAPGLGPTVLAESNRLILYAENTVGYDGELTLAAMDTADFYLISVDGWVDSEHRLHVEIDGNSPDLIAEVYEWDQETMEELQQYTLSPDMFTYDMDLYITVGPGMHLIKLYHADSSILNNQTWSNNLDSLEYDITITKVTTEIGEEPWFAPSEEAKFWGSTVRWILGLGMMLPALYLVVSMRNTRRAAARIGAMKERLEILSQLLDEGKKTPEQTRKSLVQSLQAVATLPWESAIASWGEPKQSYTTDGTSIAVWTLDPRLAKSSGNWPILVGLNTEHETWEIAAFRFDAPYGQALSVDHVEPRLLHQGEEVFIDTIAKRTTVFLTVDLTGDATQVDVELNGHVDGVPRGMRIPTALSRFDEEE